MDPWRWLQQVTPQLYDAICKGQRPNISPICRFIPLSLLFSLLLQQTVCGRLRHPAASILPVFSTWKQWFLFRWRNHSNDQMTARWSKHEDTRYKRSRSKNADWWLMWNTKRGGKIMLKGTFQHLTSDDLAESWQKNRTTSVVAFSWRANLACFRKLIKEV